MLDDASSSENEKKKGWRELEGSVIGHVRSSDIHEATGVGDGAGVGREMPAAA
jgi:hypothetical protein